MAGEDAGDGCRHQARLLNRISHELRGPLTALQLQLDRVELEGEASPAKRAELLTRMRRSIARLYQIAEGILEVARVEGRRLDAPSERVDLRELAAAVVAELGPRAAEKQLELVLDCDGPLPRVEGDPELLRRAVQSLIANAIEFSHTGSVMVALAADDAGCSLAVTDTGPGISIDDQARIFEPFAQGEAGLAGPPRPGLGLTLARDVVESNGGSIAVESASGSGARFTVWLPAATPP